MNENKKLIVPQLYLTERVERFQDALKKIYGEPTTAIYLEHEDGVTEVMLDKMSILNFIRDISFWEWEIESILESFSLLNLTPLSVGADRIVPVLRKDDPTNSFQLRKKLVGSWNKLILSSRAIYDSISEEQKLLISEGVDIDFNLYYK